MFESEKELMKEYGYIAADTVHTSCLVDDMNIGALLYNRRNCVTVTQNLLHTEMRSEDIPGRLKKREVQLFLALMEEMENGTDFISFARDHFSQYEYYLYYANLDTIFLENRTNGQRYEYILINKNGEIVFSKTITDDLMQSAFNVAYAFYGTEGYNVSVEPDFQLQYLLNLDR